MQSFVPMNSVKGNFIVRPGAQGGLSICKARVLAGSQARGGIGDGALAFPA